MIVGGLEPSTDNEVLPWGDAGWLDFHALNAGATTQPFSCPAK